MAGVASGLETCGSQCGFEDERVVREIIPQLKALGAEGIIEYPLNRLVY